MASRPDIGGSGSSDGPLLYWSGELRASFSGDLNAPALDNVERLSILFATGECAGVAKPTKRC
ncbi:hypothetical protein GCM10011515_18620 [Tsuneonella deserti]|uniref:Uncharacterized protein n=1 Tax=Tsuneonella deserti TaxID=2035528 RepID=A0ABQ1SAN7_9SPHN|nr:hypothetical protein GCM10011515_18620 [Tsuneonella deserti]